MRQNEESTLVIFVIILCYHLTSPYYMLSLVITHFIFTVTLELDIHMPIVQMRKSNLRNLCSLSRVIQPVKGRTWT